MKIRCYKCGRQVSSKFAVRRKMATESIAGDTLGSNLSYHQQSYSVSRMVDLCPACAKEQDASQRLMAIGFFIAVGAVAIIYLVMNYF